MEETINWDIKNAPTMKTIQAKIAAGEKVQIVRTSPPMAYSYYSVNGQAVRRDVGEKLWDKAPIPAVMMPSPSLYTDVTSKTYNYAVPEGLTYEIAMQDNTASFAAAVSFLVTDKSILPQDKFEIRFSNMTNVIFNQRTSEFSRLKRVVTAAGKIRWTQAPLTSEESQLLLTTAIEGRAQIHRHSDGEWTVYWTPVYGQEDMTYLKILSPGTQQASE